MSNSKNGEEFLARLNPTNLDPSHVPGLVIGLIDDPDINLVAPIYLCIIEAAKVASPEKEKDWAGVEHLARLVIYGPGILEE